MEKLPDLYALEKKVGTAIKQIDRSILTHELCNDIKRKLGGSELSPKTAETVMLEYRALRELLQEAVPDDESLKEALDYVDRLVAQHELVMPPEVETIFNKISDSIGVIDFPSSIETDEGVFVKYHPSLVSIIREDLCASILVHRNNDAFIRHMIKRNKLPSGARLPTLAEELKIQKYYERICGDRRAAYKFDADVEVPPHIPTSTGLRTPKDWENGRYETDLQGRKYWPRILVIRHEEKGIVKVPEGDPERNFAITEYDDLIGIPVATSSKESDLRDHRDLRFRFDAMSNVYTRLGVSVWHDTEDVAAPLRIDCMEAYHGRMWLRLVQGPLPNLARHFAYQRME